MKYFILLCLLTGLFCPKALSQDYTIAYSYNESGTGNREIYLTDPQGQSKIKITDFEGGNGYSAWSPDGKQIAFYAKYDDKKTWSIHSMNADGSNRKRLTDMPHAWDNSPSWSPDGRKIVFARAYKDTSDVRQYQLWSMNADGTNQQQIKGLQGGGPYFAPDGRIVYHSQPEPNQIYIAHADGSHNLRLTNTGTENWHPEVSSDGTRIAFMSNRDGNHEIYVMNMDGSDQKRLTFNDVDDWYPSWSPDGSALIFSSNRNDERQIYQISTDGSSVKPIIHNGSQAAWLKQIGDRSEATFNYPSFEGPYMGQKPPGMVAEPFAPGVISTDGWEVEGVFAPGMNEFYFTTSKEEPFKPTIIGFRRENNIWRKYTEFRRTGETAFSPDGSRMHMAKGYKDRDGSGWTARKSLGPLFDRADWGIMRLTTSAKGTYVFDDYKSGDVIRISTVKDGTRQPPVVMDEVVNSGSFTAHPFIAPDESYLIWDSERAEGFGDSDLYIRFKQADGSWGPAINMGESVNTENWEAFASVTSDGKYMLFNRGVDTANHNTDLYWVDAAIIEQLRPQTIVENDLAIAYGSNGICLTNKEGTSMKRLTSGDHGYPAWSPDGKKIAFYSYHDEKKTWSIHTVNRDGTGHKRLTHVKYKWDNMPTWSPDGSTIVFAREYDSAKVWQYELWRMNADGSEATQLTGLSGGGPSFMPDGRLLFHSEYSDKESEISIVDLESQHVVHLTDNDAEEWDAKISPDGSQIAFTSNRDGNHEIYLMKTDGSNQTRLTYNEVDDYGPTWSPDGTQLVFQSTGTENEERSNLYIMNVDGSSIRQVISEGWQPAWFNTAKNGN